MKTFYANSVPDCLNLDNTKSKKEKNKSKQIDQVHCCSNLQSKLQVIVFSNANQIMLSKKAALR